MNPGYDGSSSQAGVGESGNNQRSGRLRGEKFTRADQEQWAALDKMRLWSIKGFMCSKNVVGVRAETAGEREHDPPPKHLFGSAATFWELFGQPAKMASRRYNLHGRRNGFVRCPGPPERFRRSSAAECQESELCSCSFWFQALRTYNSWKFSRIRTQIPLESI